MKHPTDALDRFVALVRCAALAVLAAMTACGAEATMPTDSESHWLSACSDDAECGPYACLCGVCSAACDDDLDCDVDSDGGAQCQPPRAVGTSCEQGAPDAPICLPTMLESSEVEPSEGAAGTAAGGTRSSEPMQPEPGVADAMCALREGLFEASYTVVDSDCAELGETDAIDLSVGQSGVAVNIRRLPDRDINTEVIVNGCHLRLTVTVTTPEGVVMRGIEGDNLTLESPTRVTGEVNIRLNDERGVPSCTGVYDALFTRADSVLGGAAGN